MKKINLKGVIPPILTPFTKEGEIYEKGLRELIEFTIPFVHGFYPVGTYGCGPLMTIEERKKVAEIVIDQVNGRVPVVVHVGTADTKNTVELAKHAEAIGATSVGAVSPYYTPHTDEALYEHFKAIVDAVNIPVYAYNNPKQSLNTISPELLRKLAQNGLGGVKDSCFDLLNFYKYKMATKDFPDFDAVIGTEAIFLGGFEAGAKAVVSGVANVYPDLMNKLYTEYTNGELEKAKQTQLDVITVRDITKFGATIPTMFAILKLRGLDVGYPRRPFLPISSEIEEKVKVALKGLSLL